MFASLPSATKTNSRAPMPPLQGYPLRNVVHIHPHDVLCGRGLTVNKHVGNKMWRDLIKANMSEYATLPRSQRQRVTNSIVMAVRSLSPPGRFLMMDSRTGTFYDIGDAKANLKTAQAMRDSKKKRTLVQVEVETRTPTSSSCEEAYAMVPPPLTSPVTMCASSVAGSCMNSHQVSLASSTALGSSADTTATVQSPIPTMVSCPPPPIPPRSTTMDRLYSDDTFGQQIQNLGFAVPDDSVSLVSLDLEETELKKLTHSCCIPVSIEFKLCDFDSSESSIDFYFEDRPNRVHVQDSISHQ